MTIDCYNKRTKEYYVSLGLHNIVYIDNEHGRTVKKIAITIKCLDIITLKTGYYNIVELIKIKPINIRVNKGVFLRRKTKQRISKRAIYKICPKRIKTTKKEKNLGIF